MSPASHLKPFIPKPSGPFFIGLNGLRALSIITLVLVIIANVVTIADDIKAVKVAKKAENTAPTATPSRPSNSSVDARSLNELAARDDGNDQLSAIISALQACATQSAIGNAYVPAPPSSSGVMGTKPIVPTHKAKATDKASPISATDEDDDEECEEDDEDEELGSSSTKPSSTSSTKAVPTTTLNVPHNKVMHLADTRTAHMPLASAVALASSFAANTTKEEEKCDYYRRSTVPKQAGGTFWSVLNRIFIVAEALLLVLSEIGLPKSLFAKYIQMLGPSYGLGCLGVLQTLIASGVLSHHVTLFPQISAWLLFIVGMFNVLVGIFLREGAKAKRQLSWENAAELTPQTRLAASAWSTAQDWREKHAGTPAHSEPSVYSTTSSPPRPARPDTERVEPGAKFGGFPFAKQAERAARWSSSFGRYAAKDKEPTRVEISRPTISRPLEATREGGSARTYV